MNNRVRTIYINGRFLAATLSGVPRFGREFLRELDVLLATLGHRGKVQVLVPKSVTECFSYNCIEIKRVGRLSGHAWEQLELLYYARDGVLFSPGASAPLFHPRNLLTIHDAIVFAAPSGFSRLYLLWYRFLSLVLCRTALHIFTVSQFSKMELIRWCGADPSHISVVYPGAQHMLSVTPDDTIQPRFTLARFRYVLAVGSLSPNKNFRSLIAALTFLDGIDVVLVGQTDRQVGNHGRQEKPLDLTRVKKIGYVTDQELRSLYEHAGCFVFPSLYEGFGLPPIEALSLGCPVVVSNVASMPEVCGEVAVLCDPHSPEDIAKQIRLAIGLRQNPANAKKFADFAARYNYMKPTARIWRLLVKAASDHTLISE